VYNASGGPTQALDAGNKKHLRLVEIFDSVQGEGLNCGVPMTFVRFAKCNLACDFCDTPYNRTAFDVSEETLSSMIAERNPSWVMFTGGEPMLQLETSLIDLITRKCTRQVLYGCETNGMVWSPAFRLLNHVTISPKLYHATRADPIEEDKVISSMLVHEVQEGRVSLGEVRYLITGARDTPFRLPGNIQNQARGWILSPLFHDPNLPETFTSGQGHPSAIGTVDTAAFRRCLFLLKALRDIQEVEAPKCEIRLSVQTHKLIGVR
jgi:organic radical activating enzyme